jgi:arylsulfatase A
VQVSPGLSPSGLVTSLFLHSDVKHVLWNGLSLVAFLKGGAAPKRDYFYWELHEGRPIQAIRFGNWKGQLRGVDQAVKLYDLATDPDEKNDLATENPDLVVRAEALMKAARVDDPNWPLDAKGPEQKKK